ncbi:DUF19 domain-containing protein [Caenorhabditis elegans]|uniref:DUF19 domain-containing protein n=1 Tax=Caenorhabditis elegans TaxID=6239 RepID=Q21932_CAEEL|nr:DUF19 domain-containing protein [Caenorhabditis elegans]CAA99900.1 DUF19 domain-containing protein [Caenorhabditis elegans]|eukprot:NP_506174.1 Uncharacterized protein CELE_R11D1.3 [Caenorhabditis elegans]
MNQLTSLILVLLVQYSHGATNRDTMMDMVTQKLGVTFYTSTELGVIAKCCETQFWKTPNNSTAVLAEGKKCVLNNSGNKAVQALSLYSNANNCLNPDSLDTVVTKLIGPIETLTAALVKKIKATLNDCKKTNTQPAAAKQETCLQKTYGVAKAAITLTYCDGICKKVVNQHVSAKWWGCALKLLPSVMNTSKWNCSKIVKS